MSHTPTPWKTKNVSIYKGHIGYKTLITNSEGVFIASTSSDKLEKEEQESNTQFIVTACNAHEDLVELAKDLREYFADCADASAEGDPLEFKPNKEMTILEKIEQTLSKAGVK